MTERLRALIDAATPGPWIRPWGTHKIHQAFGRGCDDIGLPDRDIDLITAAVNALPALLDVVDAARTMSEHFTGPEPRRGLWSALKADNVALRDALARLEDPQ